MAKAAKSYGNLNELRAAYLAARRAWATRCARDRIPLYSAAIKRLYDALEAARLAYLGGGE